MSLLLALAGGAGPTNYTITADAGSYSVTGVAAGIVYTLVVPAYTIDAEAGAYFVEGQAAEITTGGTVIIHGPGNLREKGSYWNKLLSPPTIQRLEELAPEIAEVIEVQAVAEVTDTAHEDTKAALEMLGIAYQQAYFEIYTELVAEMRQAQEDEQIAMIVAALI